MRGVTPVLIEMTGVNVPLYKILPVPDDAVPTEKNAAVVVAPPVEAAKSRFAANPTVLPDTGNAAEVLATAARAYEV